MNFIKLGEKYINLENVAAVLPKENNLCYTVNFIGGGTLDICAGDMADIRKTLEIASTTQVVIAEADSKICSPPKEILDWFKSESKEVDR